MKKIDKNIGDREVRKSVTGNSAMNSWKKRVLWTIVFILIAAATVWAVTSESRAFSLDTFITYIAGTSKIWLIAAILCSLGFVFFEGEAVVYICRAFGYRAGHGRGFIYSASDIYFSGITPSASGGQPVCAYYMIKDGIPAGITTVALLLNLTMYTLSILVISLLVLITQPQVFMSFGVLSKVLIVIGYLIQCLLSLFFILLLVKREILHGICRRGIRLLCKIKLLRHEEEKQRGLDKYMEEYAMCSEMIKHKKKALAVAFIFNILQRVSYISIPLFVFLATGGAVSESAVIWAVQSYVVIGSNAVPIPGAMGVSDYIMLDGYGKLMAYQDAVSFELLSRSLAFYICIVLCGILVLINHMMQKKRERKNDRIL